MKISESWILSFFDKKPTKKSLKIFHQFLPMVALEVEDTFSRTYFKNIKVGLIDSLKIIDSITN